MACQTDERVDIETYFHSTSSHEHSSSQCPPIWQQAEVLGVAMRHCTYNTLPKAFQAQGRDSTESGSEDEHSATDDCLEKFLSLLPTKRDMESHVPSDGGQL